MLESMRNAAQGIVGKAIMTVVMGLIIVSFVIWGVGDMLRGFTSSTVASVGSQKISAQDYHFAYERLLQQYQRRLRQPFTNEQARAIGLDREVSAKAPERSGDRRGGAQAWPQCLRGSAARHDRVEPEFPRQVGRLRPAEVRRRAARQRHERANVRLGPAQDGAEAVHRRGLDDRDRGAESRSEGGSRFPGANALDRLFHPARFRGGRDCSAFRGDVEVLLQRSQVAIPGARIPGDGHRFARAGDARRIRTRSATPTLRRPTTRSRARIPATARPRNAIFSRSFSPTTRRRRPPKPRSRPARASRISSRSAT